MIKAIFFDLFFTLIVPVYDENINEYKILGLTPEEWEKYAEDDALYEERAMGFVKSEKEIIDKIADIMPIKVDEETRGRLLMAREHRMKTALQNVSPKILSSLKELRSKGIKICLISNADVIDSKYWNESPLSEFFDEAIFSCDVGLLKPGKRIYELAMEKTGYEPHQCMFVGDGGSSELKGAKSVGMQTVFTEMLDKKAPEQRERIMKDADHIVEDLEELVGIV